MATLTVTLAAVAATIDATDPGLVARLVSDVANAINIGGKPVAASGSITTTVNEISTVISYTVVKS